MPDAKRSALLNREVTVSIPYAFRCRVLVVREPHRLSAQGRRDGIYRKMDSGVCAIHGACPNRPTLRSLLRSDAHSNHVIAMAKTVVAITIVAIHPSILNVRGKVNPAMMSGRIDRNIMATITGTATIPLSTALQ